MTPTSWRGLPWLSPIRNSSELRGLCRRSYFGPRTCGGAGNPPSTFLSCPKEPATGTQACSPCCTTTWSGRMRHWIARARARRDPLLCSSRNTRAALSRDPQTRDAKWARGSRSQTHRRAAKGGFTQDDGKVRRPRPDRTLLFRFRTSVYFRRS